MLRRALRSSILCLPLLFACLLYGQEKPSEAPVLALDAKNIPGKLPHRFRTAQSEIKVKLQKPPSLQGLRELNISGSSQFSEEGLKEILTKLPPNKKITVVDLRQESHGFINGIAVSWRVPKNWINIGKTLPQIEAAENGLLAGVKEQKKVQITLIKPRAAQGKVIQESLMTVDVHSALNEQELTAQFTLSYFRIPVTDKQRPSDEMVDRFVLFALFYPKEDWLHFHCRGGSGRTTSFMAMYDMMRNAKEVALCDIIVRQYLIHGKDLFDLGSEKSWDYENKKERKEFLVKFYDYCRENAPLFAKKWSEWSAIH